MRQNIFMNSGTLMLLTVLVIKNFLIFLTGKISKEKAIELIKRNSRRYAKRQLTWWGKDKEIKWFHPEQIQEIIEY